MVTLTSGPGAAAGSSMVGTDPLRRSVSRQSFVLTLVTEAVGCEVVSTHIQANAKCSWHILTINEMQPLSSVVL